MKEKTKVYTALTLTGLGFVLTLSTLFGGQNGWFQSGSTQIGWFGFCEGSSRDSCVPLTSPLSFFGPLCFALTTCGLFFLLFSFSSLFLVASKPGTTAKIGCLPWQSLVALLTLICCLLVAGGSAAFTVVAVRLGYQIGWAPIVALCGALVQATLVVFVLTTSVAPSRLAEPPPVPLIEE
jgi:hypothetical protein